MYELLEMVGRLLAGIGLFFVGMHGLSANLKKLTGRRFRLWVARWTRSRLLGVAWGTVGGAITQSTSAVTFILVSILSVGAITLSNALPILAGSNLGASVMVFLATLDVEIAVLFVLGIAGILYTRDRSPGLKPVMGALFGAGLLFLGLHMLQAGAAPLAERPWFKELLAATGGQYFLIFIAGTALTIVVQSSVAIAVLAIHMTGAGLFSLEQCMMLVYASNLGAGLNTWLLSSRLLGRPRQLALYQTLFNAGGCVLLVPLFYVEVIGGVPLMRALLAQLAADPERQMAWLYLLFNGVMVVVMLFGQAPVIRLLARLAPVSADEDAGKVRYLHDHAVDDPETAIDLVDLEQQRLVQRLPEYLACLRDGGDASSRLQVLHRGFTDVADAVRAFLDELGRRDRSRHAFERLSASLDRQQHLQALEATLYELTTTVGRGGAGPRLDRLVGNVVEALDVVLLTLADGWREGSREDLALLAQLTGDRSALMRRIRQSYLEGEEAVGADDRLILMHVTSLCERLFWLMGRLGAVLEPREPGEARAVVAAAA